MPCVYALHLKDLPNEYRYIGVTKHSVEERLYRHKKSAKYDKKYPVHAWIRKHYEDVVATVLIDNLSIEEALELEVKYIANFRKSGYNLLNATDGGDGITGYTFTIEARKAVSDGQRGRKLSEDTKRKISESKKGKNLSKEHRKKIGDGIRGKVRSAETLKRMSEAQKGKPRNPYPKGTE
jgi:hypothetical protein